MVSLWNEKRKMADQTVLKYLSIGTTFDPCYLLLDSTFNGTELCWLSYHYIWQSLFLKTMSDKGQNFFSLIIHFWKFLSLWKEIMYFINVKNILPPRKSSTSRGGEFLLTWMHEIMHQWIQLNPLTRAGRFSNTQLCEFLLTQPFNRF